MNASEGSLLRAKQSQRRFVLSIVADVQDAVYFLAAELEGEEFE
jgi:hypothetical protein